MTVVETSKFLGRSVRTVHNYIENGRLRAKRKRVVVGVEREMLVISEHDAARLKEELLGGVGR